MHVYWPNNQVICLHPPDVVCHLGIGGLGINGVWLSDLHDPCVASRRQISLHGWSPQNIVCTSENQDTRVSGNFGGRHGNDIWKCNSVSLQCPSIGSVPSVAALSTPAACYSAGGSSDHFAHKVEHGVHSANELGVGLQPNINQQVLVHLLCNILIIYHSIVVPEWQDIVFLFHSIWVSRVYKNYKHNLSLTTKLCGTGRSHWFCIWLVVSLSRGWIQISGGATRARRWIRALQNNMGKLLGEWTHQ